VSFNVLNRRVHYWASAIVALPLLVIIASGLLLQAKKQWAWVQPPELSGTGKAPVVSLEGVLESVKRVPEMHVRSWGDVNRLDVRIGRGVAKVWLHNGYEVQVDLGTGAVLQVAYRRSDLIESIHDGSFFGGDWTKLGLFLPAGVTLLLLWCGGLWMFWVTFWGKRKRALNARLAKAAATGA
jgi:PepSY-associated TM region